MNRGGVEYAPGAFAPQTTTVAWIFYAENSAATAAGYAGQLGFTAYPMDGNDRALPIASGLCATNIKRISVIDPASDTVHTVTIGGVSGAVGDANSNGIALASQLDPSIAGVASAGTIACSVTAADPGTDGLIIIFADLVSPSPASNTVSD